MRYSVRELQQFAVTSLNRFKPDRFTLFLGTLSLLGVVSALLREATYGVNLNADGLTYISVARNLLAGEGFVAWEGRHYVSWAPLWPALLALVGFLGFDPYDASGVVNAVAFGLAIFVSGSWMRRHVEFRFLIVMASLAIVVPITLTYHVATAFSDTLFILLCTLSLIVIDKFLNEERRALLIWAAGWAALACLTRYPGVTVIFGSVMLLALDRRADLIDRMKRVGVYSLISAAPLCVWMLRNLLLTGYVMGPRGGSGTVSLFESVRLTVSGVGGWVVFPLYYSERIAALAEQMHLDSLVVVVQGFVAPVIGVALLTLTSGLVVYGLIRLSQRRVEEATPQIHSKLKAIVVFGAFALIYLVFLTVAKSLTLVDNNARHYAPAYIPILLVAVIGMDTLLVYCCGARLGRMNARLPVVIGVVICLWVACHGVVNVLHARYLLTGSVGYHSRNWIDSETILHLQTQGLNGRMYSQSSNLMYWHLKGKHWDRSSVDVLPALRIMSLTRWRQDLDKWLEEERVAAGETHVVWLKELGGLGDYDIQELMALPGLELVTELSDGVILRVSK